MKPARSPRFQSDALRASSAAISPCGSPVGGVAQAANMTTHQRPRTAHLLMQLHNVARERLAEMESNHPKDAPVVCRRRLLAATPSRRFLPLCLAAALGLGARPLLRGPLFHLGSRRLPLGS